MMKWRLECLECGKKESFGDTHDISQSKWRILAWNVKTAEPMCVCEKCEYIPVSQPVKKTK